jgi:hypothetical protein
VRLAFQAAEDAIASGALPVGDMATVFATSEADTTIINRICSALAAPNRIVSPTDFHNSVHNAAAGYWTIGAGCTEATTAISAHDASFAEGLIEALVQLAAGEEAVLLVGYDGGAAGPLQSICNSAGLLGGALVLSRARKADAPRIEVTLQQRDMPIEDVRLSGIAGGNAMAQMLPLFEALADARSEAQLFAGRGRTLQVGIAHD